MRIAIVVGPFPALSQTFILSQITGLIDRGHHVDIFADRPSSFQRHHSEVKEYQILERIKYRPQPQKKVSTAGRRLSKLSLAVSLFTNYAYKAPWKFIQTLNLVKYGRSAKSFDLLYWSIPFLDEEPYDIIHSHFGLFSLNAALLKEIGFIKGNLITSFHGGDVNATPKMLGADIYHPLFRIADLFTVNSNFTAKQAIGLGCPKEKIVKLPVGLNLSKYSFRPREIQSNQTIKILTVARLTEKKGLEYSIKAFAKIEKIRENLEYQIIGEGPLEGKIKDLINLLGLSGKVKLLGSKTQEEVRELYEESHIFMLASVTAKNGDREGQGLVLQEAQAMGLPILSTLHNGIPEGVIDGETGFLVPERDIDSLAERLLYLVEHPEVWSIMGQKGRSLVEDSFDINKLNDKLVSIYEMVLPSKNNL